ncbi:endonuclease 8-like 3 [Mytilus trossulus]|uniref:endonuclease 8-like 3 n=1 Tax=Mytilus trossulus TaxID=6551 RepID=UPI0030047011
MVEGPGCKIKGEKIKGKLKGKIVKSVHGNAVDKEIKPTKGITTSQFHQLIGRRLDEVQTVGKELFMYFGEICLRVHFLMAGSFLVNNKKLDHDHGGTAETASLEIQLSEDKLSFYKSGVNIRSSQVCQERYENFHDLDICSPVFNQKRAVAMVMKQTDRMVCDVLLDQDILPGVGNIIKNEALFDSGIKPDSKINELKEEHVLHLVKMTRDFSMIFYKCRSTGTNLKKFMKIYNKGKCTQCDGKVVICRLGEDNDRMTYFCGQCQDNNLKQKQTRTLPTKNSLLGWVQTGKLQQTAQGQEAINWACSVCTLVNKATAVTCDACMTKRESNPIPDVMKQDSKTAPDLTNGTKDNPINLTANPQKRKSSDPVASNTLKRPKIDKVVKNDAKQDVVISKIPPCPGHKQKCNMTEVRKKGDNYLRWFFSCSLPRSKQCKFFKWADESFPLCEGHVKPCTIRTVMKQGQNNGKKFFTCSFPKNKQCGHFEWAIGYD